MGLLDTGPEDLVGIFYSDINGNYWLFLLQSLVLEFLFASFLI